MTCRSCETVRMCQLDNECIKTVAIFQQEAAKVKLPAIKNGRDLTRRDIKAVRTTKPLSFLATDLCYYSTHNHIHCMKVYFLNFFIASLTEKKIQWFLKCAIGCPFGFSYELLLDVTFPTTGTL